MGSYRRGLVLDLPERQSAFLWGPRKTGNSTLLAERFPDLARFDLLETRTVLDLTREPWLFTERVLALDARRRARPIVVDEVQKVPALLDEVHRLILSRAAPGTSMCCRGASFWIGSGAASSSDDRVMRDPDRPTRRPWSRRRPRARSRILAAGRGRKTTEPHHLRATPPALSWGVPAR